MLEMLEVLEVLQTLQTIEPFQALQTFETFQTLQMLETFETEQMVLDAPLGGPPPSPPAGTGNPARRLGVLRIAWAQGKGKGTCLYE